MKNKTGAIAIVGMACKYPDIGDYKELWQNVLMQRRSFRKLPENRLSAEYFSKDDPDKIYSRMAAVIEGYHFDRSKYGISGKNFRTADLTHWLALDMATLALEDAGLLTGGIIPKAKTSVFVGNTLTGEFSRANVMRLRWPFVKKKVRAQLLRKDWAAEEIADFLLELEGDYKSSFPQMAEDSLAGGLANTIAGRICNYHDFHGGGYTVDGACSSSLLAVIEACKSLESGDSLISLAGGVDLSLDPFELVGFSRAGALAKKEMLVYDKNSNGFWPGEGCGFVVLANLDFALANQLPVYALIKGYGISSDGQGGLTRPAVSGQTMAMEKAYLNAGYSVSQVAYFEGHGTGTEVGDQVELQTIISNLNKENTDLNKGNTEGRKHYIGTIKGNIGHTKAAAGIAGLLKIVNVVKHRVIPPVTGCQDKHPIFEDSTLDVPFTSIPFELPEPMRASVSAMGFGGINTHITIEEYTDLHQLQEKDINAGITLPAAVFLFAGENKEKLIAQLKDAAAYAGLISYAELADLSAVLHKKIGNGTFRAGIVAAAPLELQTKLEKLLAAIPDAREVISHKDTFFYGGAAKSKIGFLFPGQGSKSFSIQGRFYQQFPWIELPPHFPVLSSESTALNVTQPAIVGSTMIALSILEKFGISGTIGVGHSLGEIAALAWSGVLKREDAMFLALRRGEIMSSTAGLEGLMLIISAAEAQVRDLISHEEVGIAAVNSAQQTVVSGKADAVLGFKAVLSSAGISSTLLPVKYAFHSEAMTLVEEEFKAAIAALSFHPPVLKTISSVSGKSEREEQRIQYNLAKQLSSPVQFLTAIKAADEEVDFWIELGGDKTLMNIVKHISDRPISCMSLDGHSSSGLLSTLAMTWVLGNQVDFDFLFKGIFSKAFDLDWKPSFFTNPCEAAADLEPEEQSTLADSSGILIEEGTVMTAFKTMIAKKLEFNMEDLSPEFRFLDDLHLNSLEVGQLITSFALANGIVMKGLATEYANASIQEIVEVLEICASGLPEQDSTVISGIEPWVHYFEIAERMEPIAGRRLSEESKIAVGSWQLMQNGPAENGFAPEELVSLAGSGLLINFQDAQETELITLLTLFLAKIKAHPEIKDIIVLQPSFLLGGFMKSVFLESKHLNILLLTAAEKPGIEVLKAEQAGHTGFSEVIYRDGKRFTPKFQPMFKLERMGAVELSAEDVVLVSGGGKGITAECALALGRKYGAKLLLLGRSDPKLDQHLKNNLERFDAAGITYRYCQVDLSQETEVAVLLKTMVREFGKITGFVHGAGMNRPLSWRQMGLAEIMQTAAAKLLGFRNVMAGLCTADLKMLIGFGSVIAENGMNGNADYALINEWLRNDIARFSAEHTDCKCLNVAWSVWSGAGMGEHLGVMEQLIRSGVLPIHLDKGTSMFLDWLADFPAADNLIVSGRYGSKSTLKEPEISIPVLRYLEEIRLFYPGIEIISEFELSANNDLYLKDHQLSGEYVFPAVMGMEAMEQVASVLLPEGQVFSFEQGKFSYPVLLNKGETLKIRVLATRIAEHQIKVVLRSSSTDFCQDHFEALLLMQEQDFESPAAAAVTAAGLIGNAFDFILDTADFCPPHLEVSTDLYGQLLFHEGIFRVIQEYRHLSPYHCIATAKRSSGTRYFSDFIPSALLSFEPALRDAALHCVQACVPDFRLLPVGFKKIHSFHPDLTAVLDFTIEAIETFKEDRFYVYDLYIRTESGVLVEYWEGVQFKVLSDQKGLALPLDLVGVMVQRKVDELLGSRMDFKLITSETALQPVLKRYDGKPYAAGAYVSKTHMDQLSMQVLAPYRFGCDLEKVIRKDDQEWLALLGEERYQLASYVSRVCKEQLSVSATRIWGIAESIKKADLHLMETILLTEQGSPHLHYYKCGDHTIISLAFWSKSANREAVFTLVLVDEHNPINNEKV